MTRRGIASIALLSVLVAACGGNDDASDPGPSGSSSTGTGADDDSLIGLVRTLPSIPGSDSFVLAFGDVPAIADANDVPAPTDGDVDQLLDWALAAGVDGVPIILPGVLQEASLAAHDEFDAELGASLFGTERYAGVESAPYRVGVLEGDHGPEDLTEAIGEPDDGVWSVGGEELETDIENRTVARPLGEGLRLAAGDRAVAIASTERLAVGAAEADGSLVDDDLDAVLTALDEADLVSGLVVRTELQGAGLTTSGAAYGRDGDDVVARLALGYGDADAAEAAVDEVEEYFTKDSSLTGTAWADLLTVDDVSAEGSVVVVELSFTGEQRPNVLVQVLAGNVQDLPQARL